MIAETLVENVYRLYIHKTPNLPIHIHGHELLKQDQLHSLLMMLSERNASPTATITASLFAKSYSYLMISGPLYMLSHLRQPLDLSIENITVMANEAFVFHLCVDPTRHAYSHDQHQSKVSMIRSIYFNNLAPLFDQLAKQTRINVNTLWGHATFSTFWCYDQWIEAAHDEEMKQSLREDLNLIIHEVPLITSTQVIDHPLYPEKKFRLRKDCCLNYCLPNKNHCTTCPNINEQQRMERLIEHNAKRPSLR